MSDTCSSCDKTTCEVCPLFLFAMWVLEGLAERPGLEAVLWP